ncbi:hypothetical protein E2C01_078378 [Portunus trituberculatus]|uniref:Uncharacterized protein n=1 Tax=Portunus trituberculatus TaxID=210409 RepID=A0A5B7IMG2_PORTR|nr:hypothetical protein [Portunus trituberculatus]
MSGISLATKEVVMVRLGSVFKRGAVCLGTPGRDGFMRLGTDGYVCHMPHCRGKKINWRSNSIEKQRKWSVAGESTEGREED